MPGDVRAGRLPVFMKIGSPLRPGRQQSSESVHALTMPTESLKTSAAEQIKAGVVEFGDVASSYVETKRPLEGLEVERPRCCSHSHLSVELCCIDYVVLVVYCITHRLILAFGSLQMQPADEPRLSAQETEQTESLDRKHAVRKASGLSLTSCCFSNVYLLHMVEGRGVLTCLHFPGGPQAGDQDACQSTDVCYNPLFTTKPGKLEAKEMAAARVAKLISGHHVTKSMSCKNGSTPGESLCSPWRVSFCRSAPLMSLS